MQASDSDCKFVSHLTEKDRDRDRGRVEFIRNLMKAREKMSIRKTARRPLGVTEILADRWEPRASGFPVRQGSMNEFGSSVIDHYNSM